MKKRLSKDSTFFNGVIIVTAEANVVFSSEEIKLAVRKHRACDWGVVSNDDWKRNDRAYKSGDKVFSRYINPQGMMLTLVTSADRLTTTVSLPDADSLERAC